MLDAAGIAELALVPGFSGSEAFGSWPEVLALAVGTALLPVAPAFSGSADFADWPIPDGGIAALRAVPVLLGSLAELGAELAEAAEPDSAELPVAPVLAGSVAFASTDFA